MIAFHYINIWSFAAYFAKKKETLTPSISNKNLVKHNNLKNTVTNVKIPKVNAVFDYYKNLVINLEIYIPAVRN